MGAIALVTFLGSLGFQLWFEGSHVEAIADAVCGVLMFLSGAAVIAAGVFATRVSKSLRTYWWI